VHTSLKTDGTSYYLLYHDTIPLESGKCCNTQEISMGKISTPLNNLKSWKDRANGMKIRNTTIPTTLQLHQDNSQFSDLAMNIR